MKFVSPEPEPIVLLGPVNQLCCMSEMWVGEDAMISPHFPMPNLPFPPLKKYEHTRGQVDKGVLYNIGAVCGEQQVARL